MAHAATPVAAAIPLTVFIGIPVGVAFSIAIPGLVRTVAIAPVAIDVLGFFAFAVGVTVAVPDADIGFAVAVTDAVAYIETVCDAVAVCDAVCRGRRWRRP